MSAPLHLHPDRLLPADPGTRDVARRLYRTVADAPITSPHGHVDARLLVDDAPFTDAASLLVVPDHYVTRLLHAHGVALGDLGVARRDGAPSPAPDPRRVWRLLCEHWHAFRGTPSRYWLEGELADLFGVRVQPSAATADAIFDQVGERLAQPAYRPRALFERFRITTLATTDDPAADLSAHAALAADPTFTGSVVPTFRPDRYVDPGQPGWPGALGELAAAADEDTGTSAGLLRALEARRRHFAAHGATATDHGPVDAACAPVTDADAERLHAAALAGTASTADLAAYRGHLLFAMARMSCEDGLVMQLHPGVLRGHHRPTLAAHGPDTGHDLPTPTEFVRALRPVLERFGTEPSFRLVLFTVDETAFTRDIAPLAGFYPSVWVGAPWWFLDTPGAIARFRDAVTDSAGFYKTAGFVDDTRAFCSIPARHDMSRRVDAGHLARLVVEHRLTEDEAAQTLQDLVTTLPRRVFRLDRAG